MCTISVSWGGSSEVAEPAGVLSTAMLRLHQ